MPEKFQPRTIATFNKQQIKMISEWVRDNGISEELGPHFIESYNQFVETTGVNERGKPLDEKGRRRLYAALGVLVSVINGNLALDQVVGDILVWQIGPDQAALEIRYQYHSSLSNRNFSFRDLV